MPTPRIHGVSDVVGLNLLVPALERNNARHGTPIDADMGVQYGVREYGGFEPFRSPHDQLTTVDIARHAHLHKSSPGACDQ